VADSRIDDLRRRLERDPESRIFAQLAEELRKHGEVQEAIGVARSGLERHPEYPSARLTLGRALLDSGDPAGARAELEATVAGAPDNILASRLLGEALETLGDLGSALAQYQTTLRIAPGDGHVEGRIRAIQSRLGAPEAGDAPGATADVTEPMKVPNVSDPRRRVEEEGALPPTIRLSAAEMASRAGRAPLPPVLGDRPSGETTLPAKARVSRPGEGSRSGGESGAAPAPRPSPPPLPEGGSPRVGAALSAASDHGLPPTLPPGVITAPEGPRGVPTRAKERQATAVPGSAAPPQETAADGVPRAEVAEAPVPAHAKEGAATRSPAGEDAVASATPAETALSSATLAELYLEQGLLERALEVYTQVLAEDPTNHAARGRLAQIEGLVAAGAADLPVAAEVGEDDTALRRRALERTIERLEGLLAIVRRR